MQYVKSIIITLAVFFTTTAFITGNEWFRFETKEFGYRL